MKRPLAYCGATFFLTLLMVNIIGANFAVSMGILFLICSVVIGFLPSIKHLRLWAIPLFCGFLASMIFCLGINIFALPVERELSGKTMNVEATIVDLPSEGEFPVYTVKSDITFSNGKTKSVKYKFYSKDKIECESYDILICNIEFSKLKDDYADSNYAKNIFINAKLVSEAKVVHPESKPFMYNILKVRKHLINVTKNTFDEQSAGLILGIMTGDTNYLPYDLKTNIRVCGLSHISAVSGLHIGILASFLLLLLQRIKANKRFSYLLVLIPVWLFVLVVGTPYSTIRSAFMFSVMTVGIGVFRYSDPFSSLFGSLMLCGLVSPFCALDVGLLSSASATLGLLVFAKPINEWITLKVPAKIRRKGATKYIVGSFAQTISAITGLIPCTLLFYKTFSTVVLLSNLLVLPLVTVLLFCSLMGGLLSFMPVIANPLLFVAGVISKIIIFICNSLAKIPFAEISVSRGYLTVALCGVLILFMVAMVLFTLNRGGRRLISLLLVFSILCFVVSVVSFNIFNRNNLEIYIPDDGESVSALVIYKGETTLICGDMQYTSPSKIYSTLRSVGYNKIDNLVTQEETSRTLLERISGKVKVEKYVVHKEIEDIFPRVMAKNGEISFVEKSYTTSKGVRVDFDRNRSEVLVTVGNFSALILNRGLDFDSPVFRDASVVVAREASLNKLKDISYYDVVCSCNENDREEVLRYFDENNIDGVLTAGYGGIRVWASAKGGYSLLRTE